MQVERQPSSSPETAKVRISHRFRWFHRLWRPALAVVGLGAVVWLVYTAGPQAVLQTLLRAGPWVPLVLALEFLWILVEGAGLLMLYGRVSADIPSRRLGTAFLVHMSTMLVLPVGRAGAEVARASLLSKHVGAARATAASILMQALTLLANTVVSFLCAAVVWRATNSPNLAGLLALNGTATLVLGGGMLLAMRHANLGGFLGRKFTRLGSLGPEIDAAAEEARSRQLLAFAFCVLGRLVQTLQYGVMLAAIASSFSLTQTFVAQGIHLVGAGLGDMVPNQVGVTEGAFRLFAGALGLADAPEKAVSVALLARFSVLASAGIGVLALQLLPKEPPQVALAGEADVSPGS